MNKRRRALARLKRRWAARDNDLKAYEKAMAEFQANPVAYSQGEVQKMLDPVASPRQGWAAAFKRLRQAGEDTLIIPELDGHLLEKWEGVSRQNGLQGPRTESPGPIPLGK